MANDINVRQLTVAISGVISAVATSVLQNINGENWETDDSDNPIESFFQIFNQPTAPAPGDVPWFSWRIPGGGTFNANLPGPSYQQLIGQAFPLGIAVGWSTTNDVFTPAADGGTWYATGRSA